MNTTELINLLKSVEFGASGRPREISAYDENGYLGEITIDILSTGDGCFGAELCIKIERIEEC